MNNKIVSTKTTSAIFLAIVLVAGTIALSYPSFIVGAALATSDREKDHDDDDDRKSYEKDKDRERDDKSRDHDNDDDRKSYEKDKGYGIIIDNTIDNKYGKPYENDNNYYESKYQSSSYKSDYYKPEYSSYEKPYYKSDYKSAYSSEGKDNYNNYKSTKDISKNVNIKKIKCNNINVNINGQGVNGGTGNGDNGNQTNGIGDNGNKTDGSKKIDREGFTFICINNNNNIVGGETPPVPPPIPPEDACEECFKETTEAVRNAIIEALEVEGPLIIVPGVYEVDADVETIEELCQWFDENGPLFLTQDQIDELIDSFIVANPGLSRVDVEELVDCLIDARIIVVVPPAPVGGCPDCFTTIPNDGPWPPGLLMEFVDDIATGNFQLDGVTVTSITQVCALLGLDGTTTSEFEAFLNEILPGQANKNTIEDVIACLIATGDLTIG